MEVHIQNASNSMPFIRNDLFSDIVCNRAYRDISQVWQIPGHVLVTTNEGRKLFTFDCKPVQLQHVFDSKCLDIPVLSVPLVDVKVLSTSVIILVDVSGHVMFWRYTQDFNWSHDGDVHICTSNGGDIISIAYIHESNTLFWCERQPPESPSSMSTESSPVYNICKQQLFSDLDPEKVRKQSQSSVFIRNCPAADVYALSNNVLFITTQFDPEQVMVHMTYDCADNDLCLYVGNELVHYPFTSSSETVNCQDLIMLCLSTIIQTHPGQGDLGVRSDVSMKQAAILSSSGHLEVLACTSVSGKMTISKKTITLSHESDGTYRVQTKHWFLHRGHVGIIKNDTVDIFRVSDGCHVCTSTQDSLKNVQNVFSSTSPVFLAWILTSENLFALQAVETKQKEMYTTADKLPGDNLVQTNILRLARLQELRVNEYNRAHVQELEELRSKLSDINSLSHHSQLSGIVAPYLEEYWRLERLSRVLLDSEKLQQPVTKANLKASEQMIKTLMDCRSLSKTSHHSKLLWLSEVHPQELLSYLCQGITIDSDVVPQNEMKKWQILLGMEGGDFMNFEFVCRLLFRLMPAKLLNFVKCAELVSEQAVGVSAFVRKKQSLIYYKTAWDCLPNSQTSCDPKIAASVKAKLILASESENCVASALKCLLKHGLWAEAVEAVKDQSSHADLPIYLHLIMKALAENQVLSDYAVDLFAIMPSWKSFLMFSQLATERPEIRQQQLSTSARDIFFQGSSDVRLGDVRQFLLDLIMKMSS